MNKILRTLAVVFSSALMLQAVAQHDIRIGYCNDTLSKNVEAYGNESSSSSLPFQAAICIPGARLQIYKGQTLKGVRFACSKGMTNVYAWVRPSLDKPVFGSPTKLGITEEGWNEVIFKTPIEITGDDVYVGYNGKAPLNTALYFDGAVNTNATFFKPDTYAWQDLSSQGFPSLCIQAIVSVDGEAPINDLAVESCKFAESYTKVGDLVKATVGIGNYGEDAQNVSTLYFSVNGGDAQTVTVNTEVKAGGNVQVPVSFSSEGFADGKVPVRFWISTDDAYKTNDTISTNVLCYASKFPHKVLVEHFTTLKCTNCHYGLETLSAILGGRTDYVWVAHHIGYQEDELTQQDSYTLQPLGINQAPMAMFDRRILSHSDTGIAPAFSIGYKAVNGKATLGPDFETCASTPAFVSVNIAADYDPVTRKLTTTVSGERNKIFTSFFDAANLTVELVEDRVETVKAQSGSGEKIHDHVYRCALTRADGDKIVWDGDTYKETYTYDLPENWNPANVRVVAFVNRPIDDITQADVLNAEEFHVSQTAGVNELTLNGSSTVTGRQLFNLQGQRISAAPAQGAYIEKVTTAEGVTTVKHLK